MLVCFHLTVNEKRFHHLTLIAASAMIPIMAGSRRKKQERPVYDSIRKPTAPPSKKIGEQKPGERAHPSLRKSKHKKNETRDENADL